MARRVVEPSEDGEEDGMDELERAEASIRERQKKSSKKDKGKGKEKASKSSRRDERSEEDEPEDDSDGGPATGAGGRSQFSNSDVTEKARDLVRLAICNEVSRRPLRRDEINKKVLQGASRPFQKVFEEANEQLESIWGMELVPLYPNEIDDIVPQTQEKKKKKKKRNNDDDDSNPEEEAEENAANGGKKAKRRGPARMFALRSTLPNDLIRKAVKTIEDMSPENQARYEKDLHGALGDAFAGNRQEPDEELKEWKMNDDTIFDWKTGPDQRTLIGILYVILSLILVNERVLTDEQLQNHLKRLDLRLDTRLPLSPAAVRTDKQTLSTFLQSLLRQQYLERTLLATGPAAAKAKTNATQGGTQSLRVRSTQATQRATGDDGITGDSNAEWRWGPRAFKEFGEDGVTLFIRDFYRSYQKGRPNESNAKDSKELMQEILKGATGNKPETRLIPARDDTE